MSYDLSYMTLIMYPGLPQRHIVILYRVPASGVRGDAKDAARGGYNLEMGPIVCDVRLPSAASA